MDNLFLSPPEISKEIRDIGEKKASASIFELIIFGILAGIYIAFGANASIAVLSGGTLDPGLARFLAGGVFSVGLMLVLIPGSELFTGNILMVIGFIYRKYSLARVLRNWFMVYLGNLLGAMIIVWLVYKTGLLMSSGKLNSMGITALGIAEAKLQLTFSEALCRGILCNMLVCMAVIMCISSRTISGKIFGIFFPIMVFVISGFEHSVANMYFLPIGLMLKGEFTSNYFSIFGNLIPVTIGNIIGGLLIVLLHPKIEGRIARLIVKKF
ncbi:MAG: formate/nitrite transporter family protein [Candidatus Omnitrophota bacterium]